jgi:hypothetical protein
MSGGMSSRRLTRRALQVALTLLVLLAGTGLAAAAWQAAPRAVVAASTAIELRDDDGNTPMFDLGPLRPGEGGQRCIEVTVVSGTPARVGIAATGLTTGLDNYLDLDVESGSGGGFGSCGGFSGTSIYHGTLAEFLSTFPAGSPLEDWTPTADGQRRTYRITVRLRDDQGAQGGKAAVNLVWRGRTLLDTDVIPSTTPTPSKTPTTTDTTPDKSDGSSSSTPSSDTTTGEGDGTSTSEPTDTPAADTATSADKPADHAATSGARHREPTVGAPATGAARRDAPPVETTPHRAHAKRDGGVVDKVTTALGDAANEVAKAAAPAAKRAAFPLVLVALLLLFIALQNRLDSRDPKLAHAPVHRTPDLSFEPHPPGAPTP